MCDLRIQEPGISNFEHAQVRITWDNSIEKRWNWITLSKNAETGISLAVPEITAEVSLLNPYWYWLMLSYTIEGYPGISHYKNLILAYPKATFQSVLMQGYSWISHSSGHPGISLYHFFRWWACFSTAISLPCFNPQALICRLQFCTICWNWLKSNRTCVWTKQDLSSG